MTVLVPVAVQAFPRGFHHRSLWHFFAPFVPVELLVPEEHGDRADALLRELLAGPSPGAPSAGVRDAAGCTPGPTGG